MAETAALQTQGAPAGRRGTPLPTSPLEGGRSEGDGYRKVPPKFQMRLPSVPAAERWRGRGEPGILAPMHVPYLHMPGAAGRRAAKGPSKRPAVPARRQRR